MKRTTKLISATAMLIFNLFVCFASVFAWFYANTNPEANDIGMMIDANELTLAFELYKYDVENKQVISVDSFDFNEYDIYNLPAADGRRNNDYTAIILKVTLFSNLFIANEQKTVTVSLHCTTDNSYDDVLSNILYINSTADAIDESDIYFNTKTSLAAAARQKFITTTKLTDITYSLAVTPTQDRQVIIYSVVDYDKALVDAQNIDINNVPDFVNDIEYIRYGVEA